MARSRRMPQGPRVQAHRSTGQPPDTARSRRTPQGPCLEGNDYAAAGLSAQGMRWTQGKGYAAGKDPFPVRETLSSACRPSFMRSFLRVIIPRARDAPICLPSARHARLLARNFRPCAPDAPICLPPVRPVRLPARNFCPCAPGAFACLPPARPRLPARNFCPCAGRSRPLAVRPARAPPCAQFLPVRRAHFAPARFEPHGNGGAYAPFILTVDWLGWLCCYQLSKKKISSTCSFSNLAIFIASSSVGLYLSFSIAIIVWRLTLLPENKFQPTK